MKRRTDTKLNLYIYLYQKRGGGGRGKVNVCKLKSKSSVGFICFVRLTVAVVRSVFAISFVQNSGRHFWCTNDDGRIGCNGHFAFSFHLHQFLALFITLLCGSDGGGRFFRRRFGWRFRSCGDFSWRVWSFAYFCCLCARFGFLLHWFLFEK